MQTKRPKLIMWTFIELIVTLITMPFLIKKDDWCWRVCFIYIACCMVFTPIVGIIVFKLSSR